MKPNSSKNNLINRLITKVLKLFFFLAFTSVASASVSQEAERKLVSMIEDAQNRLARTEQVVSSERQAFARKLNNIEQEVLALRETTAVARRLEDERTLSLSQLESRLESWNQQQVYQRNLLHRFLQKHDNGGAGDVSQKIDQVVRFSHQLEQNLYPSWRESEIILPSGEITKLPILSIGPITWYWDRSTERAGLASVGDDGIIHAELLLSSGESDLIAELRNTDLQGSRGNSSISSGELVFDPTINRALVRQQQSESVVEHVMKGGLWVLPILFFAIFALVIALIKVVQLWRLPKIVRLTPSILSSALSSFDEQPNSIKRLKGMQKALLDIAYSSTSKKQIDDQMFMQLQDNRQGLERWISAIAITAAVSPLLGLLGTVSGMIETFKMMTLFGSGDPEVVSGGIAQALVTTELGLVVAIPALILNAVLSRKAKAYYNDLESFAIVLSKADYEENKADSEERKADSEDDQKAVR